MIEVSSNTHIERKSQRGRRFYWSTLFCAASLLICILLSHPVAEAGVIDDWAYIWSAKVVFHTGRIAYQGWAEMMLGWQLYLGALFIKLFGFSFTVVRASIVVLALLTAAITHRVFLRLGLTDWNAVIATLTFVLSPMFLKLSTCFMSDVPGIFAILVCLYFCLRAIQTDSEAATVLWIVAASVSNDILGTVRQIVWLGALVMVPSAAFYLRRRRNVRLTASILWVLSIIVVLLCLHWFKRQPYALHEPLFYDYHRGQISRLWELLLAGFISVLPLLSAFLLRYASMPRRIRNLYALAGATAGVIVALVDRKAFERVGSEMLPELRLDRFSAILLLAIAALTFAGVFCFADSLIRQAKERKRAVSPQESAPLLDPSLLTLLAPFTLVYLLLVVTRGSIWPRYLLPVVPVFLFLIIRVFTRQTPGRKLPVVCVFVMIALSCLGIANTHDSFAESAARRRAVDDLLSKGIPRDQIEAGPMLDGYAQLEMTGYLNSPHLSVPAGAYHPRKPVDIPPQCHDSFLDWTPSIQPRFEVTEGPSSCYPSADVAPVRFYAWLPPHNRAIYSSAVQPAAASTLK